MSLELLYTSAASGLRQGSRGFCTVLSTSGMPGNLAQRLETLSGYRHVFSPQDDQAAQNPISFSHVRIRTGGQSSSVLSRVAAYGTDYSGRTNKLAHHIVVDSHEQSPAGPAWLLAHANIMRTQWDGQNQTPPTGPTLPQKNQSSRVCTTWDATTGDAGWGGYLAGLIAAPSNKPVWILFDLSQSQSLLSLLDESIALLPETQRWSATFSTYYTNLPPEIDCRVRCVLAGTDEARLASARGTVIDLTAKLPPAAHSPLTELARSGTHSAESNDSPLTDPLTAAILPAAAPPPVDAPLDSIDIPPGTRPFPDTARKNGKRATPPPQPVKAKPKSKSTLILVSVIALLLLASGAAVYGIQRYANSIADSGDSTDPQSIRDELDESSQTKAAAEERDEFALETRESSTQATESELASQSNTDTPEKPVDKSEGGDKAVEEQASSETPVAADTQMPSDDDGKAKGKDAITEVSSVKKDVESTSHKRNPAVDIPGKENEADSSQQATDADTVATEQDDKRTRVELHYSQKNGVQKLKGEAVFSHDADEMHEATSVSFDDESSFEPIEDGTKIEKPEFPSSFMYLEIQRDNPLQSVVVGFDSSPAYSGKKRRHKFDGQCLELLIKLSELPAKRKHVTSWQQVGTDWPETDNGKKKTANAKSANRIKKSISELIPHLTLEGLTEDSIFKLSKLIVDLNQLKEQEIVPDMDPKLSLRVEHVRNLKELCGEIVSDRNELTEPQTLGEITIIFRAKAPNSESAAIQDLSKLDTEMTINPEFVLVLDPEQN
ncbi:GAP1-N2 domain-containing protein [Allorhodopirellula solitaria]|uniref:Uncharacterized protein n=1 Tax=Allorhodopirellula solitaria TaxID=2527987 RepID=A0A5C5XTV8_9BACT|nr:hypothetical protein [Allorhodopirellula solitaria]TWT66370.1 hypothetical protein CA85_24640 [Allorhodopirellula solitaria]